MARTEREEERMRSEVADLLVLPRPAKSLQNGAGFSGKIQIYWACQKGKSASVPQREGWQVGQSRLCQKRKGTEPSVQSTRS